MLGRRVVSVLKRWRRCCVEKEKGGGRRKKNRSHRATVQAPAKTAREEEGGGMRMGGADPGETLNRCVKPLSAFLLGNARSGASRKTI